MSNVEQFKTSRRGFLADAITGVLALPSGADLYWRKKFTEPAEDARNYSIRFQEVRKLEEEAFGIYPLIPDEAFKDLHQEVVIGYDHDGQPVKLGFLEGNNLVQGLERYVYSRNELDQKIGPRKAQNGETVPPPLHPDGTPYTLREEALENPEAYNHRLRSRIDSINRQARYRWVDLKTPKLELNQWTLRDTIQAGLMAPFALRMLGRLTSVIFPHATLDEVIGGVVNRFRYVPGVDQERIEKYLGPHLEQITQTFDRYLFRDFRMPWPSDVINFLTVGEGFQAGFDALAFYMLSKQVGKRVNIVGICSQERGQQLAAEDWLRLQQMGLVDNFHAGARFLEATRRFDPKKYFDKANYSPLVVVMRNIDSPFAASFQKHLKEVVLPAISATKDQYMFEGTVTRLMVTSESKEKHPKLSDLNILDDPNHPLKLVVDCELNPAAREEDNWSDRYVSVLDLNTK